MPQAKHPQSYPAFFAEVIAQAADEFKIFRFECATHQQQTKEVLTWAGFRSALLNTQLRYKSLYNEEQLAYYKRLFEQMQILRVMKDKKGEGVGYRIGPVVELGGEGFNYTEAESGIMPATQALVPAEPERSLNVEEQLKVLANYFGKETMQTTAPAPVFIEGPVQEYKPAPVIELNAFEREASRLRAMALVHRSKISALHAKDKQTYMEEHKVGLDGLPAG